MIGHDKGQNLSLDHVLKKLKKQQRFTHKMTKLISGVEGRKIDSLNDCLNWVKGLLKDFVALRNTLQ